MQCYYVLIRPPGFYTTETWSVFTSNEENDIDSEEAVIILYNLLVNYLK